MAVACVGSDRGGAWAQLAAGGRYHGEVVIGADGVHSTVRRQLFPEAGPAWAGYVAWRGVLDETSLEPATTAPLAGAITYCILERSHLLTYPIADPARPRVLRNWVWYRNVASRDDLNELRRDREGTLRELSVPAGAVADAAVGRLRQDADRQLPWPLAALVSRTPAPFLQVVVDVEPPGLVRGRVCMLGDAGFAVRPHAAAGTAKAAEEARLLAEALARDADVHAALTSWEQDTLALGRNLVARSRSAGERAQHEGTWNPGEPLPFGLRRVGDSEAW
jgi:2,6-dihydroxypyridine 3-monooxygenase